MAKHWFKRYKAIAHYSRDSETFESIPGGPYSYVEDLHWPARESQYIELAADEYDGYQYKYIRGGWANMYTSNRPASYSDFINWYGSYNAKVYTYDITEDKLSAWEYYATFDYNNTSFQSIYRTGKYTLSPTYTRGEYVDEVIGEDGVYPDSGRYDGDGYWYERDRLATQFYARVNGKWVETESYVRVSGVWRRAELGVLKGKSIFSIDEAGNAKVTGSVTVGSDGSAASSFTVNVYHGGFAEV